MYDESVLLIVQLDSGLDETRANKGALLLVQTD